MMKNDETKGRELSSSEAGTWGGGQGGTKARKYEKMEK